jgi:ABC-2 type transport system ATP-binding protein
MGNPIIQVDGVVKVFGGSVYALDGLTLNVEAGTIYGLLGRNGAGKTTLIRVLSTLLPPDGGRASVAGFDVRRDPEEVRARIGLAGQYAAVDDYLTGRENVVMVGQLYGLSRADARRQATEVIERIGLSDVAGRQVKTYSGGIRRRLDLAASLVGRPQVLFLDEPTAGLDPVSRMQLWELIQDLVDTGTTVLLTTQYLDEADHLADRIAVIDRGTLIGDGTGEELKDRLGGTVLELRVPESDRDRAMATLRDLGDREPIYDEHRKQLLVPAPDGPKTLMETLRRLDAAAITPDNLALRKPTLDEVFLALTGRGIADQNGSASTTGHADSRPDRTGS